MKAAVHRDYGPPEEVVHLEDIATPECGDDDVLVRVRAAGVNWADASMTIGKPHLMRLGYGLRSPRKGVRGMEVAGIVEVVGQNVTQHAPGDEVFGWSTATFAEFTVVKEDQLIPKPSEASFEQAAGIPVAGCVALQAVRDIAHTQPGHKVLVNGASGGIGSFTVQIAKGIGADVTGVCSTANLEFVGSLGADRVIDYTDGGLHSRVTTVRPHRRYGRQTHPGPTTQGAHPKGHADPKQRRGRPRAGQCGPHHQGVDALAVRRTQASAVSLDDHDRRPHCASGHGARRGPAADCGRYLSACRGRCSDSPRRFWACSRQSRGCRRLSSSRCS